MNDFSKFQGSTIVISDQKTIGVYVDESIHDRAGFILTSVLVARESIDEAVDGALSAAGLKPGLDEFKSSALMREAPHLRALRSEFGSVVGRTGCSLALVISAVSERAQIADQVVRLLEAMMERGRFEGCRIDVYLDEGMQTREAMLTWNQSPWFSGCRLLKDQDSRVCRGLQVADHCAHTASTILLADMGFIKKTVKAGEHSGYDPDLDIDLEFVMWADLRYSLASGERAWPDEDQTPTAFADYDAFGLFVSDQCSSAVKQAALQRFAAVYMGCIH